MVTDPAARIHSYRVVFLEPQDNDLAIEFI